VAKSSSACPDNRTIDLDRRTASTAFALLGAVQVTLIAAITVITVALPAIARDMRLPFLGAYAASKAAVSALTRAAAREYIADGIRINAISPGPIDTPMSLRPGETGADRDARLADALPAGRAGTVGEAAAAVLWLASPEAGFTVGHDLVIDGGATA
jgi:NAD(P)-dependent dehydrogenase (short-subunit alcohol dehydrogenase family)